MRWLHFILSLLLYAEKCAATFSMAYFTKIANLEFNQSTMHHICGISVVNCASECNTDVGCSAFNYNRITRTCRLLSFDLFNQTAWPEFSKTEEWTVYVTQIPRGQLMTADCSTAQQSSTNRPGWNDADRACDGVTDTDYRNPQHCAHTQSSSDNWWQVELLLAGPVAAVEIYFRSDCCPGRDLNLSIYVCGTKTECDANAETSLCGYYPGPTVDPTLPQRVNCSDIRYGRFLRIRQTVPTGGLLTLCEVQAFS